MSDDPWRLRCPKGHAAIDTDRLREGYYCEACDRNYGGEPYDAADTEFPAAVEPHPSQSHEELPAAVYIGKAYHTTVYHTHACQHVQAARDRGAEISDAGRLIRHFGLQRCERCQHGGPVGDASNAGRDVDIAVQRADQAAYARTLADRKVAADD